MKEPQVSLCSTPALVLSYLLASNWNTVPDGPDNNKELYETQVRRSNKLGMIVPSVVLPQETNIVISPEVKSFDQVKIINVEPLVWDYRL